MTSRFPSPRVVRRVRLRTSAADESTLVDVHLADGRITGIHPASAIDERADEGAAERPAGGVIDGRGLLALPGLVNAHAHVDKSWWGLPWQSYGGEGGTEGRIRHERARRDELGIPSVEITRRVLAEFVRHGTTAIRTHVDVDPGVGLRGIEAVRAAVAEYDGALTVQIVAFPQDGVLRRPVVLELLAGLGNARELRVWRSRLEHLPTVPVDASVTGRAQEVLTLLAEERGGRHRGIPLADLLIAGCAERAGLELLHADRHYELIAAVTGQPHRRTTGG